MRTISEKRKEESIMYRMANTKPTDIRDDRLLIDVLIILAKDWIRTNRALRRDGRERVDKGEWK